MGLRILASVLLLLSVLFMPFWFSVLFTLGAMLYFSKFYEAIFLFLLSDLLYGTREVGFFNMTFISFITSILIMTALEFFKRKIRFY